MGCFITSEDREKIQVHLRRDESILWCGKPEMSLWSKEVLAVMQGGGMLLAFSIALLCHMRAEDTQQVQFVLWLMVGIGAACMLGAPIVRWVHTCSWLYALTNQRAMLLRHNELRQYPLYSYLVLRAHTPEQGLGDIVFEQKEIANHLLEYGFLRVRESQSILLMLNEQIQKQMTDS